ncbi:MAG: hypothetical protein J6B81_04345 [Spirochaetaceae bacterium]|nr:hypothetical protein [Spirochaetaceae bacterium]
MKKTSVSILHQDEELLFLEMNTQPRDFAQAKLTSFLEEKGWIAEPVNDDQQKTFTFKPWFFTETRENQGLIQVAGQRFNGTPLIDLFEYQTNQEHQQAIEAVKLVISAIESAINQGINLPQIGPGGTLIAKDGSILFLPQTLFTRAAERLQQQRYSSLLGCWINPGLNQIEGLRFTEAVYAYRCTADVLPYPTEITERRHEDYFDKNFIPLQLSAPGVSEELALFVNRNLQRQSAIRIAKRNTKSVRVQRTTEPCVAIPPELIKIPVSSAEKIATVLEQKKEFAKKQEKRIKNIRFVRKHDVAIKIASAVVIAFVIIGIVSYRDSLENYTTKGLNSFQTCRALYTGIDTLDVKLLQIICKTTGTTRFIDSISSMYITSRVRESFEENEKTFSPAKWLYFGDKSLWISGLTNLKIDGIATTPNFFPYTKAEKPEPITQENGKILTSGEKVFFNATYYYVQADETEFITVYSFNDTVTMEYKRDRWYVTDINRENRQTDYEATVFFNDYNIAMEKSKGFVPQCAAELRQKYPWIPTTEEVTEAAFKLYDEYELPSALKVLQAK